MGDGPTTTGGIEVSGRSPICDGELTEGVIERDGARKRVVLEDFSHGLECVLNGAASKIHAGCHFVHLGRLIAVSLDQNTFHMTRGEARDFVEEHGR